MWTSATTGGAAKEDTRTSMRSLIWRIWRRRPAEPAVCFFLVALESATDKTEQIFLLAGEVADGGFDFGEAGVVNPHGVLHP